MSELRTFRPLRIDQRSSASKQEIIRRHVTSVFTPLADNADAVINELSRLSLFEREAHSNSWLPDGPRPTLSIGAVVAIERLKQQAFVCMQPACDAIRIRSGGRRFSFIRLEPNDKEFSLVVKLQSGEEVRYKTITSVVEVRHFAFVPDPATGTVCGRTDEKLLWSTDKAGRRFEWLADMRRAVSGRLAQALASQTDRLGLD